MARPVLSPRPAVNPEPPLPLLVRDPQALPAALRHPVVAIGNFDGAHRGHAAVIARALGLARQLGRPAVALTFEPHPVDWFAGPNTVFRLTPEDARTRALGRLGVAGVIVLGFDHAMAVMEAEAFVAEILVQRLQVAGAVVGYDFHFGRARAGSPAFLAEAGARHGFAVAIVDKVTADANGSPEAVHSNAARLALEAGDVALAGRLLGHSWFVVGTVVHGRKLGRTLGFPTANIVLDRSCRLRHGIYAVRFTVDAKTYEGVASFGLRPTVDSDGTPLLEVFAFDFDGDLYGRTAEVAFIGWIRGEEKFADLDALVAAMNGDKAQAKAILAALPGAAP